jgi:hypothetical protein
MPRGVVLDRAGAVDQESVGLENSAVEGESRFDEFRANVVQTTLRIPLDSGGSVLRMFAPFKPEDPTAKTSVGASQVTAPQGVSISKSSPPEKGVKAYDDSGQRIDEEPIQSEGNGMSPETKGVPANGQSSGQATTTTTTTTTTAPSAPAVTESTSANIPPAAPTEPEDWEAVDPDDVFKNVDKSGAKKPAPKGEEEGFVEEELW